MFRKIPGLYIMFRKILGLPEKEEKWHYAPWQKEEIRLKRSRADTNWNQTRKPHNAAAERLKRQNRIRIGDVNRYSGTHARCMREWYERGGAPRGKEMQGWITGPSTIRDNRIRVEKARHLKDGPSQLELVQIKEARQYAASLKKKNPKAFNTWFESGRLEPLSKAPLPKHSNYIKQCFLK